MQDRKHIGLTVITIALMLFPKVVKAQNDTWIGADKASHIVMSSAGTLIISAGMYNNMQLKDPVLCGAVTMFGVGLGKEFVYDNMVGGKTSLKDVTANFVGCAAMYGLMKLTDKYKSKSERMRQKITNSK